jgi:alpha-beta hydrolase superfamily lysophospholipase
MLRHPAAAASPADPSASPHNGPVAPDHRARGPWRRPGPWLIAVVAVVLGLVASLLPSLLPTPAERASAASALRPPAAAKVLEDERAHTLVLLPREPRGRLALYLHGSGGNEHSLLVVRKRERVANALLAHGYVVAAALAGGNAWGNRTTVQDYRAFTATLMRRYHLTRVYLIAESMGGLAGMQLGDRLAQAKALVGIFPVCDLRTMVRHRSFTAAIHAAWAGRSANAVEPVTPARLPMLVWASDGDTIVPRATNAASCVARAKAAGTPATLVSTVGDHGDPSNFQPAAVVAFFDAH